MSARRRVGFGELEAAVLDILWDDGGWLTPTEVHSRLVRRPALAYTTVLTVLVRLCDKGMLERRRVGRAFAYRPCQDRAEHVAARMGEILAATSDRSGALTSFVATLTSSERAQVRRMLGRSR